MAKDAALLVLGVGFPMVFSANTVKDGRRFVWQVLGKTVGVSAMVAAYLQLASFNLPAELVLQVIATVLVLVQAVAQRTPGSEAAGKLCGWILAIVGLAYFWHTTVYLLTSSGSVNWPVTWRVLAMAVWFPVALMPFTYLLAFAMACGLILTHLRIHNGMRRPPRRVRLAVLVGLHLSARLAHGFPVGYRYDVGRATSFREASAVMSEYRRAERSRKPDDARVPTSQ